MSRQKSQTFVFGAIILLVSNILVKIIGAFFRVPLTHIVGVEGMAYFNAAYNVYVMFYNVSTAGIPVAVSRMVAASTASGNPREARKIFNISLRLFFVIGIVGTAAMMLFAKSFAGATKMPDSFYAMLAIAPTIFFICLSSAYRGYFQGMSNMVPTAVSQVIEAVGKLGIGLGAAVYLTRHGAESKYVAAFVIAGVTIGVAASMVYAMVVKIKNDALPEYREGIANCRIRPRMAKDLLSELIITAIPITLASSIMGLTNFIDTFLLARRLISTGITEKAATAFYGTFSSMVIPLFSMTPTFIYPFAISAIPAISSAIADKDKRKVNMNIESAFRNCSIIAIPCAIGLSTMSRGIIGILFPKVETIETGIGTVTTIDLAAPALSLIACAIFFLGIIAITNSILQTYRLERLTIFSTCSGIAVKFIATYIIAGIPNLGIIGSAAGTMLCHFTIMALNMFFVIRYTHYVPNIRRIFMKPLIAGICCGLSALGVSAALGAVNFNAKLTTLCSIFVAVIVYVVVLLLSKGISREDVMMMPKGAKICSAMDKFNLLEKQGLK